MTPTDPPDELLTPARAAALIGIHPDTLGDWARAGRLTFQLTRPGGHRRYKRSDVDALVKAGADEAEANAEQAS